MEEGLEYEVDEWEGPLIRLGEHLRVFGDGVVVVVDGQRVVEVEVGPGVVCHVVVV